MEVGPGQGTAAVQTESGTQGSSDNLLWQHQHQDTQQELQEAHDNPHQAEQGW
jgi:hypothetical protein